MHLKELYFSSKIKPKAGNLIQDNKLSCEIRICASFNNWTCVLLTDGMKS